MMVPNDIAKSSRLAKNLRSAAKGNGNNIALKVHQKNTNAQPMRKRQVTD